MMVRDIDRHFAWQAWRLWHWTGSGGRQNSSTQLCHRFLSHTTLSHKPFTHNFVTHNSYTQTTLSHTRLFHTQLFHTQLCHIHLCHTQSFAHNFVTPNNSFTHTHFYIHKLTHTQHCRTLLFHPTCLAPSPFLPAFPISFSHLLGDHWKKLICGVIRSFNFYPQLDYIIEYLLLY